MKEEGKEGDVVCKSRPRRRSTLKKNKMKYDKECLQIIQENKQNRQLQCGIKRKSLDYNNSAFKPLIKNLNNENLICSNAYQEDRKEEVLTDNDWYSLKMPSFKDYNLSNAGNDWASKLWIDDRLSDSSRSNKLSNSKFQNNSLENRNEQDIVDREERNRMMNELRK